MYYIDEASGGVLRERDSQVTGLHSPPVTCGLAGNGLSGTLLVWNGEGVGGWLTECSVVYNHQGDSLGREETGMGIRRICFCFWWLIREQWHRMIRKGENGYLRIGGNRCSWSSNHRSWFHWMIIEGYLHQSNTKSILSRITEPIFSKLSSPLNCVNEGRSIHSSAYSISLRIVNVFLKL